MEVTHEGDVRKAFADRNDDQEYIVRLVGRVITVSLETLRLVRSLPDLIISPAQAGDQP